MDFEKKMSVFYTKNCMAMRKAWINIADNPVILFDYILIPKQ